MKVVKSAYKGPMVRDTDSFIEKSLWQHGYVYDYSLAEYTGSQGKVTIICREHGSYTQRAADHSNKAAGCPQCKNESTGNRCRVSRHAFIEFSKEIHGDFYDYSGVDYINSRTPVKIICPLHGDFMKMPTLHTNRSSGCYECHIESLIKPQEVKVNHFDKFDTAYFISRASEVHENFYLYDGVNYKNNSTNVLITCPVHGDFKQKPSVHLNGSGCTECRKDILRKKYQKTNEEFETGARKIHGRRYDYSKVEYTSNKNKVEILCPDHGIFWQTPNNHLYAEYGCPTCADKASGGWGRSNGYYNTSKESNLYLIELRGDKEHFLKIGLSKNLKNRHNQITSESGYSIEEVITCTGKANELFEAEFEILNNGLFKKYKPKNVFGGVSECFRIEEREELEEFIKGHLNV